MDSTPIYTELQQTLIDPEADSWVPSGPPEFVATVADTPESGGGAHEARKSTGRSGGRRHRAED